MERSKALGLTYQYFPNLKPPRLVFEDGVCYTTDEAILLARVKSAADLRAIHLAKKVFGGVILKPGEGKETDQSWFELEPPVFESDPSPFMVKKKYAPDSETITLDI